MRIFEFQINGEKEWVAANTIIEAIQIYEREAGQPPLAECDASDDIVEVLRDKWKKMTMSYTDEQGFFETFLDFVMRIREPAYMCSTIVE